MPSLQPDYLRECRTIFLRCAVFVSDELLRTVFVTNELHPLRTRLPNATSVADRVDRTIEYLLNTPISNGQPALSAFLAGLCDRSDNDYFYGELQRLYNTLSQSLIVNEVQNVSSLPKIPLLLSAKMLAELGDGVPLFIQEAMCAAGAQPHTHFTEEIRRADLPTLTTALRSFPAIVADISGFDPLVLVACTVAAVADCRLILLYAGNMRLLPEILCQPTDYLTFISYQDKGKR